MYNVLFNALNRHTGLILKDKDNDDHIIFRNNKVSKLGRKCFLGLIRNCTYPLASEAIYRKFNVKVTEEHWLSAFNCCKETRLQALQWKILHNIYPTGTLLKK